MNKNNIILILIFIIPLCLYFYLSKSTQSVATIDNTKPQIIKFSSKMCSECQKMGKTINEIYPRYKNKIQLIEIDVQNPDKTGEEYMKKYNITLVPTIVFLHSNQSIYKQIEGSIDEQKFEEYIKETIKND